MGPLAYVTEYVTEDEPLLTARANSADLGGTVPVRPEVGAALRFIACAVGARTAVEIGTGCGSSGIWLLRGMRPGGILTSVDTEPEYQRMARQAFTQAGFAANQSRLILGRALDVLPRLSDGGYDIVFCDADARDYPDYLAAALRLLRPGGVVAFNDVLTADAAPDHDTAAAADTGIGSAFGSDSGFASASDSDSDSDSGEAAELASMVHADERLIPMLLPLGDGMLTAVLRGA